MVSNGIQSRRESHFDGALQVDAVRESVDTQNLVNRTPAVSTDANAVAGNDIPELDTVLYAHGFNTRVVEGLLYDKMLRNGEKMAKVPRPWVSCRRL